ncbi:hypothetical protein D3C77_710830 [compost metagenome]
MHGQAIGTVFQIVAYLDGVIRQFAALANRYKSYTKGISQWSAHNKATRFRTGDQIDFQVRHHGL